MNEEWRAVVGYEGHYEVSNLGAVRKVGGPQLKLWPNDQGYVLARLSGPRRLVRVHRMVAAAFVANPDGLPFVNHLDCVRNNNVATNLEWCTQWHNLNHSTKLGRMPRDFNKGKRSTRALLTDADAAAIRERYAAGGCTWVSIGREYGVCKDVIGRIIRRETYV